MVKRRARQPHARVRAPAARPVDAARPASPSPGAPPGWPSIRFFPAILGLGLAAFGLLGLGPDPSEFLASILGAALVLVVWNAWLLRAPGARARGLIVTFEARRQHYMQVLSQATVFLWWGFHLPFPLVTDHLPLLAVQLAFAYGFDMLLGWSRHGRYTLGFGPFPVIFSINLFLWFKADWFYLQFVIIAGGFAAKELIRWNREGRRVHIFNPSSFPLAVVSVVLILTASTDLTHGELLANSQNGVPYMYLVLFTVALIGQVLFGVASMTLAAVATTYLFGLLYLALTGTYFFLDSYIPVSVFLGMLLLVTDPSTAPRTELGRLIFGALYGLSTVALFQILLWAGVPPFYDKLLQVPLLNLSVRALDRVAKSPRLAILDPERLGRSLKPRWRYLAYASIWAAIFATMSAVGGIGERHPGQWWPTWIERCEQGRERACAYLATVEHQLCRQGSGWACNEAAILGPRSAGGFETRMDGPRRAATFHAGCNRGFVPACNNLAIVFKDAARFERAPPTLAELPLLLRGSRRWTIPDSTPESLYARACAQGWPQTCERTTLRSPP